MRATLANMFKQIKEFFARMTRKDRIRLAIAAVVVVVLAIVAISMLGRTNYATVYTGESDEDTGNVFNALVEMEEDAKVEGRRVIVPESEVDRLKVELAAQGLISSAQVDTSFLEMAAGFNISEDHAAKLYEMQTASYIQTALMQIDKIQSAIVEVNFGEFSPFVVSGDVRDASASVMVVIRNGDMLTDAEAQTIGSLVRGSIPGIKDENISIIDANLNSYPMGEQPVDIGDEMTKRMTLQSMLAQQLRGQAEQILSTVFGMSNVKVLANVDLNFDRVTTDMVEFAPPVAGEMDGIVRSSSELYENQRAAAVAEGAPGTDTNALGTVEYPYANLEDGDEYRKSLIEKNYEINETRTAIEHEEGTVQSVGIGVTVDSESVSEDYTEEVTALLSNGLGVPEENISVDYMVFAEHDRTPAEMQAELEEMAAAERRREMLELIIKWAVILLLGLAFIFLVRAILRAIKGPEPVLVLAEGDMGEGEEGIDYMADDDLSDLDLLQDEEDVSLQKKSTALEQIEKFIDNEPAAVAQLLRNWLTDN